MEGANGDVQFNFAVLIPARRPRAWERAPRASFASRHRGRKVWKRYELRQNDAPRPKADQTPQTSLENTENIVGTPNQRPVKRLRNAPGSGKEEGAPDATQYIATLREKASATPKSTRSNLAIDR